MKTKEPSLRVKKLNELLKETIGAIILRQTDLGKDAFLTITKVETASDTKNATVYVSTIVKAQEQNVLDELQRSAGAIQHTLNRTLRMKPVPRITFAIDKAFEKEQRVYELLTPKDQ